MKTFTLALFFLCTNFIAFAQISGTVSDNNDNMPLIGVTVSAGPYLTYTNWQGSYTLNVPAGTYDVYFEQLAYNDVVVYDTTVVAGEITILDIGMWDKAYPPACAYAESMDNGTWLQLSWCQPQIPGEISMDDGIAEDFALWQQAGSRNAVRFSPMGYPLEVIGGRFYVGDGEYPGPFLGTQFSVAVYASDGAGGMPGTMLDSTSVTVDQYGWVNVDWMHAQVTEGDFYLSMIQTANNPLTAPLGVDMTNPVQNRSYNKYLDNQWQLSPYQDFMIRAWVKDPGKVHNQDREVENYMVYRCIGFDPDSLGSTGYLDYLLTTQNLSYNDMAWYPFTGWGAFCIKANFSSGERSDCAYTNIVGNNMDMQLTTNFTLSDGSEPSGIELDLVSMDYPHEDYSEFSSSSGEIQIDTVWKGHYTLIASKYAYEPFQLDTFYITSDTVLDITLDEAIYNPVNLYVDPVSLKATWSIDQGNARSIELLQDYYIYLDDTFVGMTQDTEFTFYPLPYGQEYTAGVCAHYVTGISDTVYYDFTSYYLEPPRYLVASVPDNAALLSWEPPLIYPSLEFTASNKSSQKIIGKESSALPAPNGQSMKGHGQHKLRDFNSKAWAYNMDAGTPVHFYLDDPGTLIPFGQAATDFIAGADIINGTYYGVVNGGTLIAMDTATGVITQIGTTADMTGLAWDQLSHNLYGVSLDGNVYIVDTLTGSPTLIGYNGAAMIDCACDNDGVLYSVDIESDMFLIINTITGAASSISLLPFDAKYAQGMACDHSTNTLYHAAYNNDIKAGQLYTVDQTGTYTLLGNFDNDAEITGFALKNQLPASPAPGLLGYNIYRDSDFIAYVEQPDTSYVDQDLPVGYHEYSVTALYDLEAYGYPGDTGESVAEGPAIIFSFPCFDLEFTEDWEWGMFETQYWTVGDANWQINEYVGNPSPSAEFAGNPGLTNYSDSLESYYICAMGLTEGKIWLDFDLKLDNINATGDEYLGVEVWNYSNSSWNRISTFNNEDGSFDWTSQHLNIKNYAMNNYFRIRFLTYGVNSSDIDGWYVDNINVYRQCEFPGTLGASVDYSTASIILSLIPDGNTIAEWLHWDDGVSNNFFGSGYTSEYDVAARWDATQLIDYDSALLTQIAFFPKEAMADYRVRVWKGANADELLTDQPVNNPIINAWNYITLDNPVPIDITQDLWIGYHVIAIDGYPVGCDDGPAIDGYGNMTNVNGYWQSLLEFVPSLDYNWNIQGFIQKLGGTKDFMGNRMLTGFNFFMSYNGGAYELLQFDPLGPQIIGPDLPNGLYCFKSTAIFESETDYCESDYSNDTCVIMYVGMNEQDVSPGIKIYPNPATDHVNIISDETVERIMVYNTLGLLIYNKEINSKQFELKTGTLQNGIYFLRLEGNKGTFIQYLIVKK